MSSLSPMLCEDSVSSLPITLNIFKHFKELKICTGIFVILFVLFMYIISNYIFTFVVFLLLYLYNITVWM